MCLLGEDLGDQPPDACSKNDCSMPRGRSPRPEWPKDKATSIKKSVKSRCGGACAEARRSAMRDKRDEKKGQRTFPRRDTHHCASLGPRSVASPPTMMKPVTTPQRTPVGQNPTRQLTWSPGASKWPEGPAEGIRRRIGGAAEGRGAARGEEDGSVDCRGASNGGS